MKAASALTRAIVCAVDPGIRGSGVAWFDGAGLLYKAMYIANTAAGNDAVAAATMAREIERAFVAYGLPDQLLLEMPVVRDARHSKGDPNDLIPLAAINGALAYCFRDTAHVSQFKPEEWKGQVEKLAMNRRIVERLNADEQAAIVNAGALIHNVHDAIGIGLHYLGRLKPTRAYARG